MQRSANAPVLLRIADPIDFIPGLFMHIYEVKGGIVSNKVEKVRRDAKSKKV